MERRSILLRAALVIAAVWLAVWGIRAWAGTRRITAEKVEAAIARAHFADWSKQEDDGGAEAARRDKELRNIAALVNRLDFKERQRQRADLSANSFFDRLNAREKELFFDLTIRESMNTFMSALDSMPAQERKRFVEQGLREIETGKTEAEMQRTRELGDDMLAKAGQEGMRAYLEKASPDTKLDLAPLMEAMNEVMQGMRGNQFSPGAH